MSTETTQVATVVIPPLQDDGSFNINHIFKKHLYHWPLFILGVVIAMGLAYYYLKVTSPVYPVLATLKFDVPTATSTGVPDRKSPILQELDPVSKPVIVENEIEVLQSKKIIFQVVKDLQLWVSYSQKSKWKNVDIYKLTPVKFEFVKQPSTIAPEGEKIKIQIINRTSFVLQDDQGNNRTYKFSTPVKSDFGIWRLLPTATFENYIGSTITIVVQDPDLVADAYQKNIKAALEDKNAPFVNISTSDIVPQRGKDVLNELLSLYQKAALAEKNKESEKILKFINSRYDSIRNELYIVEKRMANYKSSQGITDINSQAQGYENIKQNNLKALTDVNIQLKSIEVFENYFNSPSKKERLPAIAGISDNSLIDLYNQLTALQLQREQLLITLPEKHPIFVNLNRQISTLQTDFREKIAAIKSSLLETKRQLQSFGTNNQASIRKAPLQDKEYGQMKRDQEMKEKLYNYLMELRESTAMRFGASTSDSEIVDDAHAGKVKWPSAPIVYALALIMGLVAPVGLLYARESFREHIVSRKEIEETTQVPVLAELSYQDTTKPIVVTEGRGKFVIGEQFRVLRTNLYYLHGSNERGRVTLFTSSVGSEGKSFVCSNLAVTLAYASRKTIILEMDLRKPKVSLNFGLSPDHPGVSDYLAEESTNLEDLIQHTHIKGVDIMSCGPIHPNPSELLEKNKLDELIYDLQQIYDDILIDSPPIHIVTDAKIIARVADASIYMVMQGYTKKDELDFIREINQSNLFPKYRIVFNGIKSGKYGYGYNYSSSYYNSYNTQKDKVGFGVRIRKFFSRF